MSAAVTAAVLAALVGCTGAPPASDSSTPVPHPSGQLTVEFGDERVEIQVAGLECSSQGELVLYNAPAVVARRSQFTASVAGGDAFIVGAHLREDLWFASSTPFEYSETGVSFDGIEGTVMRQADDLEVTEVVDEAATLSGSLDCG